MDAPTKPASIAHDTASIDNEHSIQLGMLNALSEAVEKGETSEKIHEILNQLTSYSELHFMSEELLMRMYAYPDYDDHVLDHTAMTERLQSIMRRYANGQSEELIQTINEIREFLLGHIGSRDQVFSDFLADMQS